MFKRSLSLQVQLFFAMLLLVFFASILIAGVTAYSYKNEAELFHQKRLIRKELSIRQNIDYILKRTTYPVITEKVPLIFKENNRIYELSEIHQMPIVMYDLNGDLLIRTNRSIVRDTITQGIPDFVISEVNDAPNKRFVVNYNKEGEHYKSLYTVITDAKFKPLAILNLPYLQNDKLLERDIKSFLNNLLRVSLFMLVVSIGVAYLLSNYITRSIKTIVENIYQTRIDKQNKKIDIKNTSKEVSVLIKAYNEMIDKLEESAQKLAKSERESAWREMAKQVAHEIKNPLTPMRLTVQSFERRFNPEDPNIIVKVKEYSKTLIDQIDTLSAIASAFSNFAKMPKQHEQVLEINTEVQSGLDIFSDSNISFTPFSEDVEIYFDKSQLLRIVTNLVKNALQAVDPSKQNLKVQLQILKDDRYAYITVSDNGVGISAADQEKIFEPNFTTKTSGMGLGLAMVKSILEIYNGRVVLNSKLHVGSTFKVIIPLYQKK